MLRWVDSCAIISCSWSRLVLLFLNKGDRLMCCLHVGRSPDPLSRHCSAESHPGPSASPHTHTHTLRFPVNKHRRALCRLFWFVAVKKQSNIATDGTDMFKCAYKQDCNYKHTHKEIVNITLFCYNWIILSLSLSLSLSIYIYIYISYTIMEHYIIIGMNNNKYISTSINDNSYIYITL